MIGCGAIANEHLGFLASDPSINLVGVCDRSKASALFAAERFGASAWFTDSTEMLDQAHPDVVHVLTPPQTHQALILQSLEAGAHVICEKPMTASAVDTEILLAEAKARGRMLVESRNLLFNDSVLAIDDLIAKDRLGVVIEIDILLSLDLTAGPFGDLNLTGPGVALPGGAVHDFLPHLAYLFLHFAAQSGPIGEVTGFLENRSGNSRIGFDHLDTLVRVGNCRGRLQIASDLKPDKFRFVVRGSKGSAEADFYSPFLRVEGGRNTGKRAPVEQVVSGWNLAWSGLGNFRDKVTQHGTYHGIPRMLSAIYTQIGAGGDAPISGADILATARLVDRIVALGSRP